MRHLSLLVCSVVMAISAFGCSGSASPISAPEAPTDPTRVNQELPPGAGVDDPCTALYDVLITVPPEYRDEVGDLNGRFRLNGCPPAGSDFDAYMTLAAIERGESLTVEGSLDPATANPTYVGTKIIDRQEEDKGRNIVWTMSAGITTSSVAPPRVDGTLDRVRTRWILDKNGERIERTDTIHLTFSGFGIPSAADGGTGAGGGTGDDNRGGGQGADDGPDDGDDNGGHGNDDDDDDDEDEDDDNGGHGNDDDADDDED